MKKRNLWLALLLLTASWAIPQAVRAEDELPTPDELLSRYVEALGGEDAIREQTSRVVTGTFEMVEMGMTGELKMYQMAPNKMLQTLELANVGTERGGFDGEVAWTLSNMAGPMVLEDAARDQFVRDSDFYFDLRFNEHFPHMEVTGIQPWGGEDCYVLSAKSKTGDESTYYFSVESGLVRGQEGSMSTGMGTVSSKVTIGDYREVDGILFPMLLETQVMGQTQRITLSEVSHEPIDDVMFVLPDEIKVMAESADDEAASDESDVDQDDGDEDGDESGRP